MGWRRKSWSGIGRDQEQCRRSGSRRHLVEGVGRSPVVSSAEAFDLVGSLPWLARGCEFEVEEEGDADNGRRGSASSWSWAVRVGQMSNAGIQKSCNQHTRTCSPGYDEKGVQQWGLRMCILV